MDTMGDLHHVNQVATKSTCSHHVKSASVGRECQVVAVEHLVLPPVRLAGIFDQVNFMGLSQDEVAQPPPTTDKYSKKANGSELATERV